MPGFHHTDLLPLGALFKALLTGQSLPADLDQRIALGHRIDDRIADLARELAAGKDEAIGAHAIEANYGTVSGSPFTFTSFITRSLTSPAMRLLRALASKRVIGPTPERAAEDGKAAA